MSDSARALAITSDGDILVAGTSVLEDDCNIKGAEPAWLALARYTSDGSLDPTFGDGGIAQTASPGDGDGIVVQPDGEIVATKGKALIGYAPDGSLNLTFAPDPKFWSYDALALQAGKVVVVGRSSSARRHTPLSLEVARYEANGRLDSTFGAYGQTKIKRLAGMVPTTVLAENDGKLLIAVNSRSGPGAAVRLLPNGRLDTHFGSGGIVSFRHGVSALGSQGDGKLLTGTLTKLAGVGVLDRLLGGNNCVVPGLRGDRTSRASALLAKSYWQRGRLTKRFSNKVARGRVIATAPSAGKGLPGGSKVEVVVSRGKGP